MREYVIENQTIEACQAGHAEAFRALSEAGRREAPALWHLLPRIHESDRGRVYDRLASFVPPPAGVTRAGILALDDKMLWAWGIAIPELAGMGR